MREEAERDKTGRSRRRIFNVELSAGSAGEVEVAAAVSVVAEEEAAAAAAAAAATTTAAAEGERVGVSGKSELAEITVETAGEESDEAGEDTAIASVGATAEEEESATAEGDNGEAIADDAFEALLEWDFFVDP